MKKQKKSKNTAVPSMADQDIVGLLTTLVQKLTSFEAKIDMVIQQQKPSAPAQVPQPRIDSRPMHKAICADCHMECEVPFKPSVDRPVYCKKCFAARKNNSNFKMHGNIRQMDRPAAPKLSVKLPVPEPAKPAKSTKKKRALKKKK